MASEKNIDLGKTLIEWQFPERPKTERSKAWYLTLIIIGGLLFTWALITLNFLFALIVVICAFILLFQQKKETSLLNFRISDSGIQVGQKFYPYKNLDNFWILYEPPVIKNLYFEFKSKIIPRLGIPLEQMNPVKIRKILLDYLDEDLSKENEPSSDTLARWLKL